MFSPYDETDDPDFKSPTSESATVRWLVLLAGIEAYPIDASCELNVHGETDSATFTLAIEDAPDWSVELDNPLDTDGAVPVQILAGFPSDADAIAPTDISQLASIFTGLVADWDVSFDGGTVVFTCRSFASLLTANKVTTTATNQTSTSFLTAAAAQYGLTTKITLANGEDPSTMAEVFGKEFVVGMRDAQIWKVLLTCAEADDVDLWADGTVLHYENADAITRDTLKVSYLDDMLTCSGKHSPQYANNIKVDVRVVNPKTRHTMTVRYKTDANGMPIVSSKQTTTSSLPLFGANGQNSISQASNGSGSETQTTTSGGIQSTGNLGFSSDDSKERVILRIPYRDLPYANKRALQAWNQLSRHEYTITFSFAATPELIAKLSRTTLFDVEDVPWSAFNSTPPQYASTVTSGGSSGSSSPITAQAASRVPKKYYARKITHAWSTPQEDGGEDGGWIVTVVAINHAIAEAGL